MFEFLYTNPIAGDGKKLVASVIGWALCGRYKGVRIAERYYQKERYLGEVRPKR
ncbi:MAG: hypothetical protein KGY80_10170 [Candidatus Thorarchaeota archaeon]|nr:hypothetical protein [Candidatus Thorarchaeota archaeon]